MNKPSNRIFLCLAHMSEDGVEQKYIKKAFDDNYVVPLGPNVNQFEQELEAFVNRTPDQVRGDDGVARIAGQVPAMTEVWASASWHCHAVRRRYIWR